MPLRKSLNSDGKTCLTYHKGIKFESYVNCGVCKKAPQGFPVHILLLRQHLYTSLLFYF